MGRSPWSDNVYESFSLFIDSYIERRKRVDDLKLDWLDVGEMYSSPEVVLYSREDILKQSNWTEEEVNLLFADRRFPRTEYGRKQIVEVHALIQFFARKALVKEKQIRERDNWEAYITQLRNVRPGRKI